MIREETERKIADFYLKEALQSIAKGTKAITLVKKLHKSGHYQQRISINKKESKVLGLEVNQLYFVILVPKPSDDISKRSVIQQLKDLELADLQKELKK